jgi:hypothetical protein
MMDAVGEDLVPSWLILFCSWTIPEYPDGGALCHKRNQQISELKHCFHACLMRFFLDAAASRFANASGV